MSTPQWITDRAPQAVDLDIEGMIQIPAQLSNLAASGGRSVELALWANGTPWRHTKRRRAAQSKQLQLVTPDEACAACRFYLGTDPDVGICRRRPPVRAGWPETTPVDWCGEWEARK